MSTNINFDQKPSIFDKDLGKPGTRGQTGPGKWQKDLGKPEISTLWGSGHPVYMSPIFQSPPIHLQTFNDFVFLCM